MRLRHAFNKKAETSIYLLWRAVTPLPGAQECEGLQNMYLARHVWGSSCQNMRHWQILGELSREYLWQKPTKQNNGQNDRFVLYAKH